MPTAASSLKSAALQKLIAANDLLRASREDLCNLEGPGYCESYETTLAIADTIEREILKLRHLAPPTGVFLI